MPCTAPNWGYLNPAWCDVQTQEQKGGTAEFGRAPLNSGKPGIALPCGKCLDCKWANAKSWALRCQLELNDHEHAAFATLTYEDAPPTLVKRDLQLFLKRLRADATRRAAIGPLRYFACGEYGEKNKRPHYHAILFGLSPVETDRVRKKWGLGHIQLGDVNAKSIAYVAGYTAKKLEHAGVKHERVDPTTGEVYTWQPPFTEMSRRPGIGASARRHINSWRLFAVNNGYKMPVPRYFHEAWKATASPEEKLKLLEEKHEYALTRNTQPDNYTAQEAITKSKTEIRRDKRHL